MVFGAGLAFTPLARAAVPGAGFLESLAPRIGRPYPPGEKSNDLIHWQTKFLGSDVAQAAQDLQKFRSPFVSAGVVEGSIVVRDPDGHAIQIAQPAVHFEAQPAKRSAAASLPD